MVITITRVIVMTITCSSVTWNLCDTTIVTLTDKEL